MRCSVRIYRLRDFRDWHIRQQLDLTPRFQRRLVWKDKYKSYFLDTIIRGLPTSSIHIRENLSKSKELVREVVDGQQRLTTILNFLHDDPDTIIFAADNEQYGGIRFSDLPPEIQSNFLDYPLAVNVLEDATDAEVLDIFARLNTYTVKLNSQELRNARYHGEFKSTVYRLSVGGISYFLDHQILTKSQIARMDDAELVSDLLVAMDWGIQGKRTLNRYYRDHDRLYENKDMFSTRYKETLEYLDHAFGGLLRNTSFGGKTLFYSLFCVLYDLQYGLPPSTGLHRTIPESNYEAARSALLLLDQQIRAEVPTEDMVEFVTACKRQTDSLRHRLVRHDVIKSVLFSLTSR
jgi:hypothetical protein